MFWDIRGEAVSRIADGARMKTARPRIDVNLNELDQVLDGARQAPLSEDDYEKLKEALHALAAMLVRAAQHGEDQRCARKIGRLGSWRRDSAGDQRFPTTRTWTQWC